MGCKINRDSISCSRGSAHDDGENVLVRFHEFKGKTPSGKAYLFSLTAEASENLCLPKSQVAHIDTDTGEVWIPLWLAENKGLDYE